MFNNSEGSGGPVTSTGLLFPFYFGGLMNRGWEVEYANGAVVNEDQMEWRSIPKNDMIRLTLYYDGRRWDMKNKMAYFQRKRASMVPAVKESFQIESRTIGYYDVIEGKNCKVEYTVDEFTGQMKMEVKDLNVK